MPSKWEAAHRRAWRDVRAWLPGSLVSWFITAMVLGGTGFLVALVIRPAASLLVKISYCAGGAAAILIVYSLITFCVQLILALKKQRDEARGLCNHTEDEFQKYKRENEEPIEFHRRIRDGDNMAGQMIDLALLFKYHKSLNHITFEGCTLTGPFIVGLAGDTKIGICDLGQGIMENVLIRTDLNRRYIGIGLFINCSFSKCKFIDVGFIVPESLYKKMVESTYRV